MKFHSMQFKFLTTVVCAMLVSVIFIGGLCVYEVDKFVQLQTENIIKVTCEKEAEEINNIFSDMEKAVTIMESYVIDLIEDETDLTDSEKRAEIIKYSEKMFSDVAKHTESTIAYYFRLVPEIAGNKAGFFYTKINGGEEYVCFEMTDLSLYDKDDTNHVGWFWQPYEAGEPVWMMPYYNQNNGVMMMSYVVPVYYENQIIGIVGMDFDYYVLTDKVHEIKIYEHGFAHLEVNGNIIHSNDYEIHTHVSEVSEEYLQVSEELINGMTLVLSASYDDIRQIRYDIGLKIVYTAFILVTLFSIIIIWMVGKIVKPLKTLTDASKKLANGNYDVEIIDCGTYEIKLLGKAFENMANSLREHEKQQYLLAYRDSMTGLRNTTSYKVWANEFNKEIQRKNTQFAVIVFDLNYLKEANDQYGHDVGNKLIISTARIISDTFKKSPVFRIGGDEFLVILQNKDLADYEELLEKLDLECSKTYIDTDNDKIPISIAKGVAMYDAERDSQFVDVFNRADDAMYENKRKMKEVQAKR